MPFLDPAQLIINSAVTGSIYVLIAIGLTMIYRVLNSLTSRTQSLNQFT